MVEPLASLALPASQHRRRANGFDPERFRIDSPDSKTNEVLCVSRILERKGLQHLLEAAKGLEHPPRIHIVGDGPYAEALRRRAAELELDVVFHGWLDNDGPEIDGLFRRCGIFALPSSSENFPVSLLEAMSSSMAIITTEGGGCEDVVGDAGMLTAYGDVQALGRALERLSGDEAARCEHGRRARSRMLERFAWEAVTDQYLDAYRRFPLWPKGESAARSDTVGRGAVEPEGQAGRPSYRVDSSAL